jgi:hypothetical protein
LLSISNIESGKAKAAAGLAFLTRPGGMGVADVLKSWIGVKAEVWQSNERILGEQR